MSDAVEVRGKVEFADVSEQTYGKANNHKHNIKIGGTRYGGFLKQDKPIQGVKPGDTVSFSASQNGQYWNFDPKTFQILERGAEDSKPQQKYPQNDDNRQASIVRQSSVGYASHVVAAFAQSGYYSSPDEAVADMIRLADDRVYPYAMEGKIDGGENNAPNDNVPEF